MKTAAALTTAALALALGACAGPVNSLPAGPVTVGLITSLSGIDLGLGQDVEAGAVQAVAEVNAAGGVDGHPAQLAVEDDRGSAEGARIAFSALRAKRVAGLVGPVNPAAAGVVEGLAARPQTPVLSTWGNDALASSPNVFLAAPAASRVAQRMLEYARANHLGELALAHPAGDAYAEAGTASVRAQARAFGARVVSDQSYDPATTDFGPLLQAVRQSGATLLLAWGGGAGPPQLERAWKPSGLAAPILLSPASATTAFLNAVSDSGEGAMVVTTLSLLAPDLPAASTAGRVAGPLARSFHRRNGYYPTQAALDGYAAARLLLQAIAEAGSTDPKAVDAALSNLRLSTAAGPFSYSAKDHLGLPASWLTVAAIRNGRFAGA